MKSSYTKSYQDDEPDLFYNLKYFEDAIINIQSYLDFMEKKPVNGIFGCICRNTKSIVKEEYKNTYNQNLYRYYYRTEEVGKVYSLHH